MGQAVELARVLGPDRVDRALTVAAASAAIGVVPSVKSDACGASAPAVFVTAMPSSRHRKSPVRTLQAAPVMSCRHESSPVPVRRPEPTFDVEKMVPRRSPVSPSTTRSAACPRHL